MTVGSIVIPFEIEGCGVDEEGNQHLLLPNQLLVKSQYYQEAFLILRQIGDVQIGFGCHSAMAMLFIWIDV